MAYIHTYEQITVYLYLPLQKPAGPWGLSERVLEDQDVTPSFGSIYYVVGNCNTNNTIGDGEYDS